MNNIETKFNNPQEEIAFLREQIKKRGQQEQKTTEVLDTKAEEHRILEQIKEYKKIEPEKVVTKEHQISDKEIDEVILALKPEKHDKKMEELLGILEEKGIKNTLSIIEKISSPHIEDDFHRVLVQYIKSGYIERIPKKDKIIVKELKMTLFEIVLPEFSKTDENQNIESSIAPMEQFYAGMLSIANKENLGYFSLEIAMSNDSDELVVYVSVPDDKVGLFEKQILSVFPEAIIKEKKDDFNIFKKDYIIKGSYASLWKKPFFGLKTYDNFSIDPMSVVLSSFSKLTNDEGAAIQIILDTQKNSFNYKFQKGIKKLQAGKSVGEVFGKNFFLLDIILGVINFFVGSKDKNKENNLEKQIDQNAIDNVQEKISQPILPVNIRVVVSAENEARAGLILNEIESSFNQFENSQGNKIVFTELFKGKLKKFLHNFSFRIFDKKFSIPLNLKELSTIFHFPSSEIKSTDILKQSHYATSSAPIRVDRKGVLLGVNKHRGTEEKVYLGEDDRLRHFYVIGQTGTGKTTLLKNMIYQDIVNGEGVCMIDPHGMDIEDILGTIPEERYEDVIYFDPSDVSRPMALNMLEYDLNHPEQKTFVVNEMLSIFNKLFDMKTAGGPMFEQYFRQAVLLTIDHPESGNTLADVSKVLYDESFREMKLSNCKNQSVVQFWREVAEKAGGEASLQNIVPYITSKFDVFLSNDIMGPIVTQSKSSFDFRDIMDNKKILLINLSKGKLGEINSNLIGLIIVGKILMSALSRTDLSADKMNPFYLYIDEFQNVTTDSISTILSEARKYKLSLNVAHQFIKQLDEGIKDSVFGNVGSMAVFRVGARMPNFWKNSLLRHLLQKILLTWKTEMLI